MKARLVAALAALVVLLLAVPAVRAAGPGVDPGSAAACGRGDVFCAGAYAGDITPPVTSPQFAYTYRACPVAVAAEVASHATSDPQDHLEEGQMWLLGGGPSCLGSKAGPDTELYNKTWPPSEGTIGRLQANAFVLDDGRQRLAVVQADLGGIPGELHRAVAQRLAGVGIDESRLLISATHTHGSVGGIFQSPGYAALGGDEYDPRVFEAVASGITEAVLRAAANLRPAKLAYGTGTITDANGNRSTGAWQRNPEATGEDRGNPNAHRLGVIRLDTIGGLPIGVITNFANHGVIHGTFNYFLTGDNQAFATRMVAKAIAEAYGKPLPAGWKVVDALVNGPAGDITPRGDDGGWSFSQYGYSAAVDNAPPFQQAARMENSGARQVPEALRVWRALEDELTADVTLDARLDHVCLCGQEVGDDPHDPFDRAPHEPANDDPAYRSTTIEAILGAGDGSALPRTAFPGHHKQVPRLVSVGATPQTVKVQVLRINDLGLATMPGEPTLQMGRRVERSVAAASKGLLSQVWNVGLANDYASYMATTHEFEAHDYEGDFSLYGQQTGNLLKERLVHLTALLAEGRPVGLCTRDRNCVIPPDTTGVAARPTPLAPDLQAGTASAQPADVERFQGTSFGWIGGGPSAEWSLNDALVEVQRQEGDRWVTVFSDLDPDVPVRYKKRQGLHHWTAFFDAARDLAPGIYRFHMTGHAATAPGSVAAYTLDSRPFTVRPSTALTIVKNADGTYSAGHPAPDAARNFRHRSKVAPTGTINGVAGPVPLAAGTVLPPGAVRDAYGNTNSAAITIP